MMPAWNILPTEMLTQEPAMTMGTLGGMMGPTTYIISVKRQYPKHERSSWKKR